MKETIPDIKPMRRGRPTKAGGDARGPKPSPSPLRSAAGDPFTALDSKNAPVSDLVLDDASTRFPALDDFSLLHEKGSRFSFDPKKDEPKVAKHDINQRVTNALADDAFAQLKASTVSPADVGKPDTHPSAPGTNSRPVSSHTPQSSSVSQPMPLENRVGHKSTMVSTGTMTSPSPSPPLKTQSVSSRPIFRFPASSSRDRSSSQPRKHITETSDLDAMRPDNTSRPGLLDHRSKSQILTADSSKSSRTSFETSHRSSYLSGLDDSVHRSKSANSKSRPSSLQSSKPNILRRLSREKPSNDTTSQEAAWLIAVPADEADDGEEAVKIDSNVEYLKKVEEEDTSKRKEKRISGGSKHNKRSSMPSVSLSGTKQMLAGRFGEAFRKFETNNGPETRERSHSPNRGPSDLTPIAGSEATDGRSDDGNVVEETEDVPPEVRRELERRRLSQEERRVADAGAAYKLRLAEGGDTRLGPISKAASIQSKVKSLLDESGRASPSPTKTAEGYGRFTDRQPSPKPQSQPVASELPVRTTSRQVVTVSSSNPQTSQFPSRIASKPESRPTKQSTFVPPRLSNTMSAPPITNVPPSQESTSLEIRIHKPTGPPKPQPKPSALRTGDRPPHSPAKPSSLASRKTPLSQTQQQSQQPPSTETAIDGSVDDDWETNFSKRYPDLSGLEMVETEIDHRDANAGSLKTSNLGREMRVRDV